MTGNEHQTNIRKEHRVTMKGHCHRGIERFWEAELSTEAKKQRTRHPLSLTFLSPSTVPLRSAPVSNGAQMGHERV